MSGPTPNLLVHIGFPKAGSTWLQEKLFTNEKAGFASPWGATPNLAIEHILVADSFVFDQQVENFRMEYQPGIEQARRSNLIPVISYEHLLLDQMRGKDSIRESARRIKLLYPSCKILLIIREQKAIILSSYMEHLRKGFTTTLERFLGTHEHRRLGFGPVCNIDMFLYSNIINHLLSVFGKANILVLPLEHIRGRSFANAIISFSGSRGVYEPGSANKVVRQHRKSDFLSLRILNKIGQSRYNNFHSDTLLRKASYALNIAISPLVPNTVFARLRKKKLKVIDDFIGRRFAQDNRKTSELIGIDLGGLNYDV